MKKLNFKRTGLLTLVFGVVCFSGLAQNSKQKTDRLAPFYSDCTGVKGLCQTQTICKPDETGKYLRLHRKYSFTYDKLKRVISKEAGKWDTDSEKWIPDYKQTFVYKDNQMEIYYSKWNKQKKSYDPAKEKAIYTTCDSGITAYANYKKAPSSEEWTLVTNMPNLQLNPLVAEK